MLDKDTTAIVTLLGQGLSTPHQFIRVCEAMAELGRDNDVLSGARRGISETRGWQVARLYDLACDARPDQALAWYLQLADEELLQTGRPAYARAVAMLKRARRAADAAGRREAYTTVLADLRERHRRRPALIAMLDKAALT